MGKINKGYCITIEHKDGRRSLVPLSTWENGLNLDADWHVFVPPVVAAPVAPLEVVELKKPLPIPEQRESRYWPQPIPAKLAVKKPVNKKGK